MSSLCRSSFRPSSWRAACALWWLLGSCRPEPSQPHASSKAEPLQAAARATGDGRKPLAIPGALPVAPFVAEQLALAEGQGPVVVYVGAAWCEPCQQFHRALHAGELDAQFQAVRFIEYDFDRAKEQLRLDGYVSKLIPLFALPREDGRASERKVEGSVKGDGAVANLVPRLRQLLATP